MKRSLLNAESSNTSAIQNNGPNKIRESRKHKSDNNPCYNQTYLLAERKPMEREPRPHTARVVRGGREGGRSAEEEERYKKQVDEFIVRGWTPRGLMHEYIGVLEREINAYRRKHGLGSVEVDTRLCIAAARQNFDVCFNQRGQGGYHVNACGEGLAFRVHAVRYDFGFCAEVVCRGAERCAQVVRRWARSRDCRQRLLSRDARDVGMHCGRGTDGVMYWTAVFGQTRARLFGGMGRGEVVRYLGGVMRGYRLGGER